MNRKSKRPQASISMLHRRLGSVVGNFIKPMPDIIFVGAHPKAPASEKSEKSWRDHNYCKRHRPGTAWHVSWSTICILWRTVYRRPWNHIHSLEIVNKRQTIIIAILGRSLAQLHFHSANLATHYRLLTTSQGTINGAAMVLSAPKIENRLALGSIRPSTGGGIWLLSVRAL